MASLASIAKHPIHPMLIPFPIGLWVFSFISDIIYRLGWGSLAWHDTAFYTMAGGTIGALLAAIPGAMDLFSLSDSPVKRIGLIHMTLNLSIVVLFIINLWLRIHMTPEANTPLVLSLIAILLLGVSGWLGGHMVYVHGVAVEPEARKP